MIGIRLIFSNWNASKSLKRYLEHLYKKSKSMPLLYIVIKIRFIYLILNEINQCFHLKLKVDFLIKGHRQKLLSLDLKKKYIWYVQWLWILNWYIQCLDIPQKRFVMQPYECISII